MSSTSQKHRNFVAEPMGEKPVTDLAGIGDVLGQRLIDAGYDKVSTVSYSYTYLSLVLATVFTISTDLWAAIILVIEIV